MSHSGARQCVLVPQTGYSLSTKDRGMTSSYRNSQKGDPEGQSMVFRSKHGQISIVQDICGLLIEYHNKGNSIWPLRTRKQTEDRLQHVPYSEILSVRYLPVRRYCAGLPGHLRKHFLEVQLVERSRSRPWQWGLSQLELAADSQELAKHWVQQVKQKLLEQPHRPRQLLVFINPYGGRRKARHVWHKVAAPVLAAAGADCQVTETTRPGHAEEVIKDLSLQQLQQLDGIIAVGGDGMFSELLTGVLQHTHLSAALQLRLAHIPAGSTDAVACTLHGTRDPLTATLHIALGDCTPLDVARLVTLPPPSPAVAAPSAASPAAAAATVPAAVLGACGISAGSDTMLLEPLGPNAPGTCGSDGTCVQQQEVSAAGPASNRHEKRHRQQQTQRFRHKQQHKQQQQQQIAPQLRHFVCVANYGFLGDVMELSERLRWMGPVRYDVAGALRWLLLRGYKATVWYKPAEPPVQQQEASPLVEPSAVSPLLHHPQPGLHATAPAHRHQQQQQQQHSSSRASSSDGAGSSSSGGGSNRSSFELQHSHAWSSGRPSPEPPSGLCQGGTCGNLNPGAAGGPGSSNGRTTPAAPASAVVESSAADGGPGAGAGQHPDRHAGKSVSPSALVYATAGSVSSMTSSVSAAAGLATRTSSVSSSNSRCHSRCLLCGAAAMQRSNSRSLFVADSQQGKVAGTISRLEASSTAAAADKSVHIAAHAAGISAAATVAASPALTAVGRKQSVVQGCSETSGCAPVTAADSASPSGPGWVKVEGNFASIMCVVTSCRSDKSKLGLMPEAHLADGRLVLVMVEKRSRLQYLRFLVQLASQGIRPDMLPFVRVQYVTDVQVQTEGKQSSWNVDGELLKHSRVRFGVHDGLVDVFARGVEMM